MITQETIGKILDEADIVDVIADFLPLKKRGANFLGNCPFHDEKTDSFTVSKQKGIYKCFGCGAAGNAVKFVMEYSQMNYPEALKYLAEKYKIEVEETEQTSEEKEKRAETDSLQIVNNFANDHFKENLFKSEEGQTIGMAYFKERGLRENTIERFELGYSIDKMDHFTKIAVVKQYDLEYLKTLGLTSKNGYDFYRGRVIFPIHSVNGKVIGFGARTLKKDKKTAKYFNSPENPIYSKSKVLYGLYQAKRSIAKGDECFLVEGYTDVISMSQAGIENVVASSGTALTEGQIRLIKRFTSNITMLYDGDAAGMKAAFRGIDLILAQDMNVKVVQLPDGEDPDSFAQAKGAEGFRAFIADEKKDFITFKTSVLLEEAANDPIKKTEVIRDIVKSIAQIPDTIKRSLYIKDCSSLLDIEERILVNETNKMVSGKVANAGKISSFEKKQMDDINYIPPEALEQTAQAEMAGMASPSTATNGAKKQEADVIRVMLEFGTFIIDEEENQTVAEYALSELEDITFDITVYQKIFDIYKDRMEQKQIPTLDEFTGHDDADIQRTVIDLTMTNHHLSDNWFEMHEMVIPSREENFDKDIYVSIGTLQLKKIDKMIKETQTKLKNAKDDKEMMTLLKKQVSLSKHKKHINDFLGSVIR
jgi:DNA primase